jgi:hypothetical protein
MMKPKTNLYLVYVLGLNKPKIHAKVFWENGDLSAWDTLPPDLVVVSPCQGETKADAVDVFRHIWPVYKNTPWGNT